MGSQRAESPLSIRGLRSADEQVSSLSGLLTVTSRTRAAIPSQLCRQTIEDLWEWVDSQSKLLFSQTFAKLFEYDNFKTQISSHLFMDTGYLILYGHRSEVFDIAWWSGPTAGPSSPINYQGSPIHYLRYTQFIPFSNGEWNRWRRIELKLMDLAWALLESLNCVH